MVKVAFYPTDVGSETNIAGRTAIQLFGRTLDGKRICVLDDKFQSYFYVIPEKTELIKKIDNMITHMKIETRERISFVTKTEIKNMRVDNKNLDVIKVFINNPNDRKLLKDEIEHVRGVKEIRCADLPFTRAYLMDNKITPLIVTEAEGDILERSNLDTDYVILADKVFQNSEESLKKPKILAFDIEVYTDQRRYPKHEKDPIIMLSFYGNNFKKVFTWKKFKHKKDYIEHLQDEYELLTKFRDTIIDYQPDFLVGYFSDGFDLPYINERAKKYNLKLHFSDSSLKISNRGEQTTAKIKGFSHIDVFKFIKGNMQNSLKLDNYTLNTVAEELLGEKKHDIDTSLIGIVWDNKDEEQLEKYCEYNLRDSELTYKLFEIIFPNIEELVRLVGFPLHDISRMGYSALVENYLIKKSKETNQIYPNKPDKGNISMRRTQSYQGAFVFNPSPGLYENIVVLDFQSLYPSIIVAHNIDPFTLTQEKTGYETPEIILESGKNTTYHFTSQFEGFIPQVIKEIITRRIRIKELLKRDKSDRILEARSYALKTIANATYGYFAFFGARWYSRQCAESIAAFARKYILDVIHNAENKSFKVIYADTDSLFIAIEEKTKEDVYDFLEEINRELPSLMELDLEDFYKRGIFVMKKGEQQGAKKKYALISEDGKIKVRGFETIRRDWSYIAKETQQKVLEIILKENDTEKAYKYIREIIEKTKNHEIDREKMIIRTQLKKNIGNYDLISPHVVIAQKMKDKGISVGPGTIIQFIVAEGKGRIRDKAILPNENGEYDSDYYINNQIIPAVGKIFEVLGYEIDELEKGKTQSKLDSFLK